MSTESPELTLRDKLAIDRTRLANQRTFLSYTRTGLFFIATALGKAHLDEKGGQFGWLEWTLAIIGIISILFALINYFVMRKKIRYQQV